GQETIARVLYGAPAVLLDLRFDQLTEMRLEAFVRALLVYPHQPRITGDISGQDRGKTTSDGLLHGVPQRRDHSRTSTAGAEGKSDGPRSNLMIAGRGSERLGSAAPSAMLCAG